jgi:hypothetical protein
MSRNKATNPPSSVFTEKSSAITYRYSREALLAQRPPQTGTLQDLALAKEKARFESQVPKRPN